MSVLYIKDWRYKIAFDKSCLNDVKQFANNLTSKERSIINSEINFFNKYFSLEQVIDHLKTFTSKEEFDHFTKFLKSNLQNLLFIPKELKDYYKDKIMSCKPIYKSLLTFLLEVGLKSKTFAPVKSYYKTVLGAFYGKVIKKCKNYAKNYKFNIQPKLLEEYEVRTSLDELQKKIEKSASTLNLWGGDHKIDYILKFNNSFGFGKFRSNITSELTNTFTVNCPNGKVDQNDLHMQYLSNVYPGYAHFVNRQFLDTTSRHIDFGASFVINGWSTFSAWHIFPSMYTKNLKFINAKIIKMMLSGLSSKTFSNIYLFLINSYSEDVAKKILMQLSQLPGKFESRFLGAIATEIVIDNNYAINPNNYLQRLAKCNITNYFTNLNKLK